MTKRSGRYKTGARRIDCSLFKVCSAVSFIPMMYQKLMYSQPKSFAAHGSVHFIHFEVHSFSESCSACLHSPLEKGFGRASFQASPPRLPPVLVQESFNSDNPCAVQK